jgi:hypothetical protein
MAVLDTLPLIKSMDAVIRTCLFVGSIVEVETMGAVAIRQGSSGTSSRGLHVAVGNLQEYCNGIFLVGRFECSCLVFLDLLMSVIHFPCVAWEERIRC